MTFKSQMTDDLSVFYNTDEFAETVTYSGTEIPAIVDYFDRTVVGPSGGKRKETRIRVKVSDVASPAYRDAVTIRSQALYVLDDSDAAIEQGPDGLEWFLTLGRDERPVI